MKMARLLLVGFCILCVVSAYSFLPTDYSASLLDILILLRQLLSLVLCCFQLWLLEASQRKKPARNAPPRTTNQVQTLEQPKKAKRSFAKPSYPKRLSKTLKRPRNITKTQTTAIIIYKPRTMHRQSVHIIFFR